MDVFAAARDVARQRRAEALVRCNGDARAEKLVEAAVAMAGLSLCPVGDDNPNLRGCEAALNRDMSAIYFKASARPALARQQIAHELGHFWLDSEQAACDAAAFALDREEPLPFGSARVEGYGPKERRECQANVFARAFLLPEGEARTLFLSGEKAHAITQRLGLEAGLVAQQVARGTLLPAELPATAASSGAQGASASLDESQQRAAHAPVGPLLLEAGPGTGKTKTLVARVTWLVDQGVDAATILILTYSNKAAEELRERVRAVAPDAATKLSAGTFHAFGLNILRQYGHRLGLPLDPKVIDQTDALGLLEERLGELPLNHYLSLHEPLQALAEILTAIGRAKDELAGPEDYARHAAAMPQDTEAAQLAREKALEVAGVFSVYEAALRERGVLDFADLLACNCRLLAQHQDVREALRAQHQHILVDEYQDVNFASAEFLKALAGEGRGLWVVGDSRQSIYRFRGASPDNMRKFGERFPGARHLALDVNYRSLAPVVATFSAFAPSMAASQGAAEARWTAHRGAGAPITYNVATTLEAEADGIAERIRAHHGAGIAFRDQAILCRSHGYLARFAKALEALDIPVLYLGDLFERPEIRDLLSFLSLVGEPASSGLVRVASFPAYAVPIDDVARLTSWAKAEGVSQLSLLNAPPEGAGDAGSAGFAAISGDVAACTAHSAITVLHKYLFERGEWLTHFARDESVQGQQRRLAIFQLLDVATAYAAREPRGGIAGFLDWVRHLELFGDERQLRAPPAAAGSIDAVRLLTVHASKGLEFGAVHLPALAKTIFPTSRRGVRCPLPPGLISLTPDEIREEEEQCLFFVALSRARDHLHLSRALNYGVNRGPSDFLACLRAGLPSAVDASPTWIAAAGQQTSFADLPSLGVSLDTHRAEDLDQYLRCPRAYLYQRVLGLSGGREDNGYVRFHRAVYAVLRSLPDLQASPDFEAAARVAFEDAWARIGPIGHAYEPIYRRQAGLMIERLVARWRDVVPGSVDWAVTTSNGVVRVAPDLVEQTASGFRATRLRTGRAPKDKPDDNIYALLHLAAAQSGMTADVTAHFLTCDSIVPVPMTPRVLSNRLAKYEQAIAGIASGAFPPEADERTCPRCPQYFACAAPCA